MSVLLYDSHTHTYLCKHAIGLPEHYAIVAEQQCLKGIAVTCHSPPPPGWDARLRMTEREFQSYLDMVDKAKSAFSGQVDILLGMECDFLPGVEEWTTKLLQSADFDFVLGSIHPWLPEYQEYYFHHDPITLQRQYFDTLACAAESGLFHSLAHPDSIKNYIPSHWAPDEIMDSIRDSLDRIAKTGVAMELNTSGLLKVFSEMNPGPAILKEMALRNIPVTLGSDAHEPARVGENFALALAELRFAGYKSICYFSAGEKKNLNIEPALTSLNSSQAGKSN